MVTAKRYLKKGMAAFLSGALVFAFAPAVAPTVAPQLAGEYVAFADATTEVSDVNTLKTQLEAGGTVTLGADITGFSGASIGADTTLDLNGHAITCSGTGKVFNISEGKSLTVVGTTANSAISVESGRTIESMFNVGLNATLTINGGVYSGNTSPFHGLIYLADNTKDDCTKGGQITLNNVTATSNYSILTSNHTNWEFFTVAVKGGVYKKTGTVTGGGVANEKAFYLVGDSGTFEDVTIDSAYGPCVEVAGIGETDASKLTPVAKSTTVDFRGGNKFTVGTTYNNWTKSNGYAWYNSALAISNDGTVVVEDGTYSGQYGLYNFSSGGYPTIKGGTIIGTEAAYKSDMDASYTTKYGYKSSTEIAGGTYNGAIVTGGGSNNDVDISGGVFSVDPTASNDANVKVDGSAAQASIKSGNTTTYAIGAEAIKEVAANASEDDTITITKADEDLNLTTNATVVNNTNAGSSESAGTAQTVNGSTVAAGETATGSADAVAKRIADLEKQLADAKAAATAAQASASSAYSSGYSAGQNATNAAAVSAAQAAQKKAEDDLKTAQAAQKKAEDDLKAAQEKAAELEKSGNVQAVQKAQADLKTAQDDLDAANSNLKDAQDKLKTAQGEAAANLANLVKASSPASLKAKGKKGKKVTATWKAPKYVEVDGYQIAYRLKGTKKWTKKDVGTKTSYTASKLKAKKKYQVRVRGYKTIDSKRVYTSFTAVKTAKAKK